MAGMSPAGFEPAIVCTHGPQPCPVDHLGMATQFRGRDSNPRRAVQRVLSPPPLAAWLPRKMDSDRIEQPSPALEAGVFPLDHESTRTLHGGRAI